MIEDIKSQIAQLERKLQSGVSDRRTALRALCDDLKVIETHIRQQRHIREHKDKQIDDLTRENLELKSCTHRLMRDIEQLLSSDAHSWISDVAERCSSLRHLIGDVGGDPEALNSYAAISRSNDQSNVNSSQFDEAPVGNETSSAIRLIPTAGFSITKGPKPSAAEEDNASGVDTRVAESNIADVQTRIDRGNATNEVSVATNLVEIHADGNDDACESTNDTPEACPVITESSDCPVGPEEDARVASESDDELESQGESRLANIMRRYAALTSGGATQ